VRARARVCVCVCVQFRKIVINFMADVLVEKFSVSEKEILSKTSRFTGASDRAGGRKERNWPKERERENGQST